MTTHLYGAPTHVVEWLDEAMGDRPARWRVVKGPWSEAACARYVRDSRTCYPERYRVVARRDACETGWEQKRAELWERAEAGELLDVHHDSGGPFAVAVVR